MALIYVPKGRAFEYSPLALNLYNGCDSECEYCYSPAALHMTKEEFGKPKLKADKNFMKTLAKEVNLLMRQYNTKPILLCFSCDPYQKFDVEHKLTRQALQILLTNNQNVVILTKGGQRSARDFDLLVAYPSQVKYGCTLVFADDKRALEVEKGAPPTSERILTLKEAHERGIKTWISLEPVFNPDDALKLIDLTHEFCDEYKVGKINHDHAAEAGVDWSKFAHDVIRKLVNLKKDYYIKTDLRDLMET